MAIVYHLRRFRFGPFAFAFVQPTKSNGTHQDGSAELFQPGKTDLESLTILQGDGHIFLHNFPRMSNENIKGD